MIATPANHTYYIDLAPIPGVTPTRTSGYHLSSILRHIALRTGILDEEYDRGPTISNLISTTPPCDVGTHQTLMGIALGYGVEDYIKSQLSLIIPGFDPHPGEIQCDGIYGTPDALEVPTSIYSPLAIIHEIKSTSKTSARPVTEELLWMSQVMGYLHMLGHEVGELLTIAVIHPVYLVGDYRTQRRTQYKPVQVMFEKEELAANWQMVVDNKYKVMPEVW